MVVIRKCLKCGKDFEAEQWHNGKCPFCGILYWWNEETDIGEWGGGCL